ncbi:RNA polymerase sigma factor [Streptococcus rifensis]
MYKKVAERRERRIEEAAKASDWKEVTHLLEQEQRNAERRDRYHNKRSLEENIYLNNGKQRERHELVASSSLNPEEALTLKELKQDIQKAKETLSPIDRDIVEMIAEQRLSYRATARYISEHHQKMSDLTVKSRYLKALKKLTPLLADYS